MKDKIFKIISEQLGIPRDSVMLSSSLLRDYGADSLDAVEICMSLEDEFAIDIPDEDIAKCSTVQDIMDYVTKANDCKPEKPVDPIPVPIAYLKPLTEDDIPTVCGNPLPGFSESTRFVQKPHVYKLDDTTRIGLHKLLGKVSYSMLLDWGLSPEECKGVNTFWHKLVE